MPIEIFKAGRRTPLKGAAIDFSEADLAASAAAYDPALHEAPLVIGHPALDAPAYGWVGALVAEGASLFAEPRQVDPAFAEWVAAGRYKKLSASFYPPDSAANPVPGTYYLRHVGFLGAMPPSVKGLSPVSFGDDDRAITIEFGDAGAGPSSWVVRSIADLFRAVRDTLVEAKGVEAADKTMPTWKIDEITAEAARIDAATMPASPAFSEVNQAPKEPNSVTTSMPAPPVNLADLEAREKKLAADMAAFAERQAVVRRADIAQFVDDQVKAARLPAGTREAIIDFASRLDVGDTIEFSEVGGAKVGRTMLDQFKALVSGLPAAVEFGERAAPGTGPASETASDAQALTRKADAYVAQQRAAGVEVSFAEAVRAVAGEEV